MAENRLDRELETREKTRKRHWQRQNTPSQIQSRGTSIIGLELVHKAKSMLLTCPQLREGWEPVKATDHPEITLVTVENERFKDNVVIGGYCCVKAKGTRRRTE